MDEASGRLEDKFAFTLSGFFDTDGPDKEQFNSLGEERSVLVVPAEMTPGAVAWVVPVAVSAHETAGSIGELIDVQLRYRRRRQAKPWRRWWTFGMG